ncbi:MAG: TetR/AcrR family transcriptional regulator [Phenylobacterium sp.]|nr:TetR/AcrR family transcriptional regulator [Phenylobacterium sp.]
MPYGDARHLLSESMPDTAFAPAGKREITKAQNRQAILDAAREVFGEVGFETVTVRDIIRRTGLASGTFYNYFRSKEEVAAALSRDGARRFSPVLKAQRERARTWEEFVRGALSAYYGFLASEHDNWMARRPVGEAGLTVMGETPEMSAVFEEVRRSIIDEAERGGARGVDADYLAAACIGLAREVGRKMLARRPIDPATATDFAVALSLRGTAGLAEAAR